jgi:two-component system response regulator GlrR
VVCGRSLEREGYVRLEAHSGPDALRLLDRERSDLIVIDLRIPTAGGRTVARHARSRIPPIRVILITAYDSPQASAAARESGVGGYLAKRFSNAAFREAVRGALLQERPDGIG